MLLCKECLNFVEYPIPENASLTFSKGICELCMYHGETADPRFYLVLVQKGEKADQTLADVSQNVSG